MWSEFGMISFVIISKKFPSEREKFENMVVIIKNGRMDWLKIEKLKQQEEYERKQTHTRTRIQRDVSLEVYCALVYVLPW